MGAAGPVIGVERHEQGVDDVFRIPPQCRHIYVGAKVAGDSYMAHVPAVFRIQAGVVSAVAIVKQARQRADALRPPRSPLREAFVDLIHLLQRREVVDLYGVQVGSVGDASLTVAEHLGHGALKLLHGRGPGSGRIERKTAAGLGGDVEALPQGSIVARDGGRHLQAAERLAIVHLAGAISVGGIEVVDAELDGAHDVVSGINAGLRPLQRGLSSQAQRGDHAAGAAQHAPGKRAGSLRIQPPRTEHTGSGQSA